jgi:hypothetical protein
MGYHNGFGFSTSCDQENEALLRDDREIDKLAFATAATVTALVTVVLASQKLPAASIH